MGHGLKAPIRGRHETYVGCSLTVRLVSAVGASPLVAIELLDGSAGRGWTALDIATQNSAVGKEGKLSVPW